MLSFCDLSCSLACRLTPPNSASRFLFLFFLSLQCFCQLHMEPYLLLCHRTMHFLPSKIPLIIFSSTSINRYNMKTTHNHLKLADSPPYLHIYFKIIFFLSYISGVHFFSLNTIKKVDRTQCGLSGQSIGARAFWCLIQ